MAPRGETREKLIRTTGELLQRQGYNATGMNQILAESQAPKGSLYFHFPGGKEELAAAAVERSAQNIEGAIEHVLASAAEPGESIERLVATMAAGLDATSYAAGCPLATVALETAATSDRLQQATNDGFNAWLDAIAARLRTAGWPGPAAGEEALVVLSTLEGGLVLARARRDPEPLRKLGARLRAHIDQGPPAKGPDG